MSTVADFLAHNCSPADKVLVETDIGVLSYHGNSAFTIADGAALASPELRRLSVKEQISLCKPVFVVQSHSDRPDGLSGEDDRLQFLFAKTFESHSVEFHGLTYYCNVYRVSF
jgi:hypothetical protein